MVAFPLLPLQSFVASRVSVILELSDSSSWRYVPSVQNPADITRGRTLVELAKPDHIWRLGPPFFKCPPHQWPKNLVSKPDGPELLNCGLTQLSDLVLPDTSCSQ